MAQVCTPESLYGYDHAYKIADQSTLDTIASECTSINGSIYIMSNYTGPFYLPNIRNISGDVHWYADTSYLYDSISFPDLEHINGSLDLQAGYNLRNISAPKLNLVGRLVQVDYAHDVDLRSLQHAEYASIFGNLSSLRLDSLQSINRTLKICNKDSCSSSLSPVTSLELYLLSLESSTYIELEGRISTLVVPELTSVVGLETSPALQSSEGFQLTTAGGPPLNLVFPRLDTVYGRFQVSGNIASLSMPKMIDTNMTLEVNAVNLPSLRRASDGIYIYSDMALDCDAIEEEIFRNVSISNGSKTCSAKEAEPESHGLSTGDKAGIGIGSGFAGIIIFVLIPLYIRHRKKEKERLKAVSEVELMPPSYQAAQQDRASLPEYSPGEHRPVASPRGT
ncbi:uncharacterized protein ANIA_01579 [Aspergillus nidulans FGSC A4]|uniref:Receptor L-domain domain-containing protein n=1 Tax=Emericella nidulans (strain FGSC A4 / ATCC 38163 / CBS 112.46 / NRRL 194 / M139) TaxID=227321 RepID=C8VN21_EMENI|nr:hypothetical protein [Aspergillus nidulans FGSC A4]CBF85151.1 TPA: hypothetical protein ANIA_01579 [Aspergillus nidulans FGSC A4]